MMGTASAVMLEKRVAPMRLITPSVVPSKSDPESPMKMLAG